MHRDPSTGLRWLWYTLWGLAVALTLTLLFATLADRPFDPEAARHFSREVLETGRRFTREARVAVTLRHLLSLGLMAWLCFHPKGARFLTWLERKGNGSLWLSLVAVVTGITLLSALVELPFDYYLGHLHEHAYGLSRQTTGQWLGDHLTSLGLSLGLGLLQWIPLYWLIRRFPRGWWAPAAGFSVVLSGFLVLVSPILFLPLEGEIVPVKDPRILTMVQQLSDRAGVPVETVKEQKVSAKSTRLNAMVTGLGATKQVIFYDTLLQQFKPAEVEVVMAHELSHAVHRDVVTGWLLSEALGVGVLLALAAVLRGMVGAGPLGLTAPHGARGLALVIFFITLTGQIAGPAQNAASRAMEVRADRFALELTGNPEAFVRTFKKLAEGNPSDVDPHPLVEFLSHSHPSIMNRIRSALTK